MAAKVACIVASVFLLQFVLVDPTCAEEPHSDTGEVDTFDESLEDLLLLQVGLQLQSSHLSSNFNAHGDVTSEFRDRPSTSVARRLLAMLPQQIISTNTIPEGSVILFSSQRPAVLDLSLQQSIFTHGREMMESRTSAALFLLLTASFGLLCLCGNSKPSITALYSEPVSQEHEVKATVTDSCWGHGSLLSCYLVVFMDAFGFGIYATLVPVMRQTFALSAQDIAALQAAFSLLQAISTPVLGFLSDRFGRRPILMISLAAEALAWLLLSSAGNYCGLLVGFALAGAASATLGVSNAYLVEVSCEEEKPLRLSYSSGSAAFGLMLGPLAGAALSPRGFAATVQFCCVLSTSNLLFVWCCMSDFKSPASGRKTVEEGSSTIPRLAYLLYWVTFFGAAGVAANETCGALFMMDSFFAGHVSAAEETTRYFALAMSSSGIVMLATSVVVIPIAMQWLKQYTTMLFGGTLHILGYIGLAIAPTKLWFFTAYLLVVAGGALATPNLRSLLAEVVGKSNYGAALGAMSSFEAAARVLDPFVFANIYERISHGAPYMAVAIMSSVALALWVSVYHAHHGHGQAQEPL
eukprot:TRINITY_DN4215_c0_g2_i1.p1 TRINITY_DN4215_c0_g2~~TRINITY_DN4215_c0_g2_i1.p1  ORF type:complete len:580 (-),score=98.38 TRINITY_DN4215_c0_g2_i1:53-1792(-)